MKTMTSDIIFHENKWYVPSMFHAAQETTMVINALRFKESEIRRQMNLAMNRPTDTKGCKTAAHVPPKSHLICLPLIRVYPPMDPPAASRESSVSSQLSHTDTLSPKPSDEQHHVPVESFFQTKNLSKKAKRKISKRKAIASEAKAIHLAELESKLINNNNSSSAKPRQTKANGRQ